MTLNNQEYEGIINDTTKAIDEDIAWRAHSVHRLVNLESTSIRTMNILYL